MTAAYRFVIVDGNITSLTFQNNSFVKNIMGPAIEFDISKSNGHVTIQQNRFLHNIRVPILGSTPEAFFYFNQIQNSSLSVTFSKNLYHNNSELLFLSLRAEPTSSTVMVTLNSESLTDNIGPSVPNECTPRTDVISNTKLVLLSYSFLRPVQVVHQSNITASNNRINIDTDAIPRGDEVLSQDSIARYSSLFFLV